MSRARVFLALALFPALAACGKNPRYCDESTSCGNAGYVCDLAGVCPESEGLTNSCIPPSAICWDAGGGPNQPDAGTDPDALLLDDGGIGYYVGGTAIGVRANVTLQVDWADGNEQTTVAADGSFMFDHVFVDGDTYTVTLVATPPCVLADETGTVDAAPVTNVALTCEGVTELSSLTLSAPIDLAPTFTPTTLSYAMDLSLIAQSTTVTATTWSPDATLTIEGAAATSAQPTAAIPLALGANTIDINVSHAASGFQRTYQVTLDRGAAALGQHVYLKASNAQMNDQFAYSVTAFGNRIAVGAYGEASGVASDPDNNSVAASGAVYVFRHDGASWVQEAYLKASNIGQSDHFGASVALTDDLLAVGAMLEASADNEINGNQNDNSADGAGAVYVFKRTGNTWAQEAYIKASNAGAGDQFGDRIALDGDTLAVGARLEDSNSLNVGGNQTNDAASNSGAVYVFRRSPAGTWSQEAYIKASNTQQDDYFGISVALSGNTLAVGAVGEDSNAVGIGGAQGNNGALDAGAAYVYTRSGTAWSFQAYVKASNTDGSDMFGGAMALDGDRMAISAGAEKSNATGVGGDEADDSVSLGAGAVYVFRRSGTVWTQEAYVKASNTGGLDGFGNSVALRGEFLLVGAGGEASDGSSQGDDSLFSAGAAYLYRRIGTAWQPPVYLKAAYPDSNDLFGSRVALTDEMFIIGAFGEQSTAKTINGNQQDNGANFIGAGYVFH